MRGQVPDKTLATMPSPLKMGGALDGEFPI